MFFVQATSIAGLFGALAPLVVIAAIWLGLTRGGWLGRAAVVAVVGGCGLSLSVMILQGPPNAQSLGAIVFLVTVMICILLSTIRFGSRAR